MVNNVVARPPKHGPFDQVSFRYDGSTRWRCLVSKCSRSLRCASRDDALLSEPYARGGASARKERPASLPRNARIDAALSPIVGLRATRSLPASFEAVDIAVLKWIAAEARRMSQR
jgi:hypothetical protein